MDGLVFLLFMKELWEKLDVITVIATLGFLGTLLTSFIVWQTDRPRLKQLEIDRENMKKDFDQHREDNAKTFEKIKDSIYESNKELRENIKESNEKVVAKIDVLTTFLLNTKITQKGQDKQRTNI